MLRWMFGLAERLHKTVGEMLHGMSSTELTYWLAWDGVKDKPMRREPLTPTQLASKLRAVLGPGRSADGR